MSHTTAIAQSVTTATLHDLRLDDLRIVAAPEDIADGLSYSRPVADGPLSTVTLICANMISESFARRVYPRYAAELALVDDRSAVRHLPTEDEFIAKLANPAITKYLCVADGELAALCMVHGDPANDPMLSQRVWRHRYAQETGEDRLRFLGSVYVAPEWRGQGLGDQVYAAMLMDAGSLGARVVFDVSASNDGVQAMVDRAKALGPMEKVDAQVFYSIDLSHWAA